MAWDGMGGSGYAATVLPCLRGFFTLPCLRLQDLANGLCGGVNQTQCLISYDPSFRFTLPLIAQPWSCTNTELYSCAFPQGTQARSAGQSGMRVGGT